MASDEVHLITYRMALASDGIVDECLLLADSRSPASSSKRQLLRKLPFRIEISAAIADPTETPNYP